MRSACLSFFASVLSLSFLMSAQAASPEPPYVDLHADQAPPLVVVHVIDRDAGHLLPFTWHFGQPYVVAQPGHRYALRIENRTPESLLAVISIDGLNIVTRAKAGVHQPGHVLKPWEIREIHGWQDETTHQIPFAFTQPSVERRAHRRTASQRALYDQSGVMGVAVFKPGTDSLWTDHDPEALGSYPGEEIFSTGRAEGRTPVKGASSDDMYLMTGGPVGSGEAPPRAKRLYAPIAYMAFSRQHSVPDQIITLYYDTQNNLIRRGIVRDPQSLGEALEAFPAGIVPSAPARW